MFFVRSIFWLSVVFVLLPVAPEDQDKVEAISPIEAVGAAAAAVRDISGFCGRNPETCETGGKAAVALGYKAKYGAQQLLTASEDNNISESAEIPAVGLEQPIADLAGAIGEAALSEETMTAVQTSANALATATDVSDNPVVSAEVIVPASATPATPTPRARPNI